MNGRVPGLMARLAIVVLAASACAGPGASSGPTSAPATPTASPSAASSATATATASGSVSPGPSTTASSTPSATANPTPGSIVVTVQAGDTLSLIAERNDTTWQSLVYWNRDRYPALDPADPAYDPNRIEIGWQLVVWPGMSVPFDAPLPSPTPRPATPTPAATTASTLVTHGSRSSTMVALTFDMGGRTDPAVAIMRWLRDHNVPATIFMTGSSVDRTAAARDVLAIVDARSDLFDLGNHSYSHPDMTTLSATEVANELRRAEVAIDAHAVQSPRPLFRPPYGAWDADVLAGAGSAGYRWTVMWDVDTIDWKPIGDGGPTADQIVAKVVTRAEGGSIILMHLGGYETLDALPGIVDGLRSRRFTLVPLERLLGS